MGWRKSVQVSESEGAAVAAVLFPFPLRGVELLLEGLDVVRQPLARGLEGLERGMGGVSRAHHITAQTGGKGEGGQEWVGG